MDPYQNYFQQHEARLLEEFFTFLSFPTISTDPLYHADMMACSHWLNHYIHNMGFETQLWSPSKNPIIFAHYHVGDDKKTILLYGHYDVQPVDPLELWVCPPFKPRYENNLIYARGAVDDKGQMWYTLAALQAYLASHSTFPLNIKILIDSEEENGSPTLCKLLESQATLLQTDYTLIVDSGIPSLQEPVISLASRGLITMDLQLHTAAEDLHSGLCGGAVYNPIRALSELIASFYTQEHTVAVKNFYDEVKQLTTQEKNMFDLAQPLEEFKQRYHVYTTALPPHTSAVEAISCYPTLEINGISSGYTGSGFKTVLPAQAAAKISCRLVPDQNPHNVYELIKAHIQAHIDPSIHWSLTLQAAAAAFRAPFDTPLALLMQQAYTQVFGIQCKQQLSGGTLPIISTLAHTLHTDPISVGVYLPTDRIHAPNEHFGWDRFKIGFLLICKALDLFDQ